VHHPHYPGTPYCIRAKNKIVRRTRININQQPQPKKLFRLRINLVSPQQFTTVVGQASFIKSADIISRHCETAPAFSVDLRFNLSPRPKTGPKKQTMNVSLCSQENSKVPSSPSRASGEVTDRMERALPGGSNTNTNSSDIDMKMADDGSRDANNDQMVQKDLTECPAAQTVQPDENVENVGSSQSPDVVHETIEKQAAVTDATSSSNSSSEPIDSENVVGKSEQNQIADAKSDSTKVGEAEKKEEAKETEPPKKRTRKKWKKPVGKPNRPLSAYNLYFRKERAIMLGDAAEKTDQEQGKKRVHRKTHGKIGFAEMARIIGAKWKKLPEEEKEEFVKVAVVEKERYAKDLANWREEQKKKAIMNSKSKYARGSEDDDDLVQTIAEDREKLLRQHQAFRMQMMQQMQVGHLGRLPGEGHGRQMPTIDYLRNMPDDRTGQFFSRNRNGTNSGLFSHYPSAAEGSGRDLYEQMVAMSSDPNEQGHDSGQMRQFNMTRSQMMNGSMADGPSGSSVGGTMRTTGGAMGGSMGNTMGNPMGVSMGAPMGNNVGNTMGNQMGSNSMGNTMGNAMGMIPMNNGASQMPNSAPHLHYEMERYQHMRYQNQMYGMNNNQMPISPRGSSGMVSHEGSHNNNMESAMGRFQQQNPYN
jgi:hypothetical protein